LISALSASRCVQVHKPDDDQLRERVLDLRAQQSRALDEVS
jgi:hypothetical protein